MKNYKFTIHGNTYSVTINEVEGNAITMDVNGTSYRVEVDRAMKTSKTPRMVRQRAIPDTNSTPSEGIGQKVSNINKGTINSPLPGTIINILVKQGDRVKVGQKLLVLEAMKMENNIDSDREGIVTAVKVIPGQQVMEGDVLFEIGL